MLGDFKTATKTHDVPVRRQMRRCYDSHHVTYSANNLFPEMVLLVEKYFQISASYVSWLKNKLNISETDLKNDRRLQMLFSTSVYEITNTESELDKRA